MKSKKPHKAHKQKRKPPARGRPAPSWKSAFLAAYAEQPIVTSAAKSAGVSRRTFYDHLEDDAGFAAKFHALERGRLGFYEDCAAIHSAKGAPALIIFMLKKLNPAIYGDTVKHEHTGQGGGAIKTESVVTNRNEYTPGSDVFKRFMDAAAEAGIPGMDGIREDGNSEPLAKTAVDQGAAAP